MENLNSNKRKETNKQPEGNSSSDIKVRDEVREGGSIQRGPHQHGCLHCRPWRFPQQSGWILPKGIADQEDICLGREKALGGRRGKVEML